MKLRCDVCNDSDAAVFCSADEAALCGHCDAHVHRANKLASRHQRSSLVLVTVEGAPPCDICGERRAFLFCQQDKAILCTKCDLSIHSVNEHAKKHDRFILTGLKLSNCSRTHSKLADESLKAIREGVPVFNCKAIPEGGTVLDQFNSNAANSTKSVDLSNADWGSLSEYLMETLPGWRVDEFLESCCSSSGINKNVDEFLDPVDMGSNPSWGFWVPQATPGLYSPRAVQEVEPNPFREPKVVSCTRNYPKRWPDDGGFSVPQISPAVTAACKRIRTIH